MNHPALQSGIMDNVYPAIFLDRDGVIIENRPAYIRSWADVSFYPLVLETLAEASASPYKIVIVTNQSAVGRGIISLEAAMEINQRVVKVIEEHGGRVDGVFMCPHAPEEGCWCRKPNPGLFFQAAEALGLDLERSIVIGDALSDLQAGQSAGVGLTVLVLTGRGQSQINRARPDHLKPFLTFPTLVEALQHLLQAV